VSIAGTKGANHITTPCTAAKPAAMNHGAPCLRLRAHSASAKAATSASLIAMVSRIAWGKSLPITFIHGRYSPMTRLNGLSNRISGVASM